MSAHTPPSSVRRIAAPLRFELTLYVRQCLRLDQQTLPFVAPTASTEADDDGEPRAFRLDPPRKQGIACRQELKVIKTHASQANGTGIFHHQKITAAAAAVARPIALQWLDHNQLRRAARLLDQAFAFLLRKFWRNPMGAVSCFDRRISASAEAQRLALRRTRYIVCLVRG